MRTGDADCGRLPLFFGETMLQNGCVYNKCAKRNFPVEFELVAGNNGDCGSSRVGVKYTKHNCLFMLFRLVLT